MKTYTTISLDVDLVTIARSQNIKLSSLFNEYLKGYLSEDLDIKLSKNKEILAKERANYEVKLNKVKAQIKALDDKEREKRDKIVKSQKEYQEAIKRGDIEPMERTPDGRWVSILKNGQRKRL